MEEEQGEDEEEEEEDEQEEEEEAVDGGEAGEVTQRGITEPMEGDPHTRDNIPPYRLTYKPPYGVFRTDFFPSFVVP